MSTYVGLYCPACKAESRESRNHGEQEAADAIACQWMVCAIQATAVYDVTVAFGYNNDFGSFVVDHCGHGVIIHDEYGFEGRTVEEYRDSYGRGRKFTISDPEWEARQEVAHE